jgi:hypothetical protein
MVNANVLFRRPARIESLPPAAVDRVEADTLSIVVVTRPIVEGVVQPRFARELAPIGPGWSAFQR